MAASGMDFAQLERRALIVGGAGLAPALVGAFLNPEHFFRAYLVAFSYWLAIPLGALALVMLNHVAGGGWSHVIRRPAEAAARTFPLMALLFVPIALGLHELYEWSHADVVANDHILQEKSKYLNVPFFLARAALFFFVWTAMGRALSRLSARHDRTDDVEDIRRMQRISAPGIAVLVLTITFASVDWVMSLDPHWFSTLFGFMFLSSDVLATLASSVLVLAALYKREPLKDTVERQHFHDLGNLLMGFVMVWAYLAFSQYLIIWSGNLQEEVGWYIDRDSNGWHTVSVFLSVFHFFVPFLVLLTRNTKRSVPNLVKIAGFLLFMRWVDLFWLIAPSLSDGEFYVSWMDVVLPVGMGGVWLAYFLRQLKAQPLLPVNEVLEEEVLEGATT